MSDGYLTDDEYRECYSKVPRLCVDLVIRNEQGATLLIPREQKPFVGMWHLPGGRVRKGETIHDAARRIAMAELNAAISAGEMVGFIEFREDQGDLVMCHSVSIAIACTLMLTTQDDHFSWFYTFDPLNMHPTHKQFLQELLQ